jgi:hypothetical protein
VGAGHQIADGGDLFGELLDDAVISVA